MKKIISAIAIFLSLFLAVPALAVGPNNNAQIPERNGDYLDPEHPGLRVHVFVHEPKEKPTPVQSLVLVCNPPDPNSTAIVPSTPWHLPSTWTYQLNPSSAPSTVGISQSSTLTTAAFNAWSTAVSGKVTFTKGADTTVDRRGFDGKNIVAWGTTSGTALAVTYIWYYTSNGQVAEVDTIFNKKFLWSWSGNNGGCADSNSYDAQDILTHETGHWMGLDDTYTSNYADNTMFGYGAKGELKKDTLTTGDIAGVQAIYP